MPTTLVVPAGRLWCYRARAEADLFEERVFADGVTPGPTAPYTVTAWRCGLNQACSVQAAACHLAQPGELAKTPRLVD